MIPELNKIYQGDCLEIMRTWPDKCVDLVLTDPPYGVGAAPWDIKDLHWFDEARRISRILAFTPGIANVFDYPRADWIVCWAKPGSTRRNIFGGFNHWEPVLIYGRTKLMVDYIYLPDIANHDPDNSDHPTKKPVNLMSSLIEKLLPRNGIVCDPFLGSGTSALAAQKTNRSWIGIEIDPKYVAIAQSRIDAEVAQGKLF